MDHTFIGPKDTGREDSMTGDVKRYFSGSKFEALYGHCRAVAVGNLIFVAGSTGYDYETGTISDDPAEQTRQTFRNIDKALSELGAGFSDVVQLTTYYVNQADWDAIGGVLKEWLEGVHPVNAGVRTGLILPEMKVEIAATAVRRDPD
jgi:enamine deaminase RidA (YjgF/YER057c/UK114 family)